MKTMRKWPAGYLERETSRQQEHSLQRAWGRGMLGILEDSEEVNMQSRKPEEMSSEW